MDHLIKNKKIFFLSPSLKKGGAENQLTKIAIHLSKNNEVKIITFIEGNDFVDQLQENSIELKVFNIKSALTFIKLISYLKEQKPSLLICFMFSANIVGRIIKVITKIPIITSVRANVMSKLYRFLYRFTYKWDDYSTFNSKYSFEAFIHNKLAVPSKSIIINNGIEIDRNIEKVNYNFSRTVNLISIAHFRPSKDYKTLFKAIKILKDKGYSINLKVLGNLDKQTWPGEMLKELGIDDEVEIVGFTQNTKQYLAQSDLLILSSFLEGTPNALLEAMSRKLPVIASNIPGNDFVIEESKAGLLFKLQDENDLANKVIDIISLSSEAREELGRNGLNFILENYELDNILAKWEQIIEKVVN